MNKEPFTWNFRGRKSTRIKGFDYSSPGHYYVTNNVQGKTCLFGSIRNHKMILNNIGLMIFNQWMGLIEKYPMIGLDAFVIMPNHMHGVIEIMGEDRYDSDRSIMDRVLPDDIAIAHPHRNELLTWVERRNAERSNQGIIIPSSYDPISRVGAGLVPAPIGSSINPVRGDHKGTPLPSLTLGDMVGRFKSITTHEYILGVKQNGWKRFDKRLWQRGFWDSIPWTGRDIDNVRDYIIDNPKNWERDTEYFES